MITAFDPNKTRAYSLKEDTGTPRTLFHLGYFDTFLRAHLEEKHFKSDESRNPQAFLVDCVRFGLKGWNEHFPSPDGKPIAFATEEIDVPELGVRKVVPMALLGNLKLEWIIELGTEISTQNFVTKEQAKN